MTAYSKRIVLSRPLRNVHVVDPSTSAALPAGNTAAQTLENQQEAMRLEQQRWAEERRLEAERWADLRAIWEGIQEQLVEIEGRRQQTLDELQQLSIELAIEVASHVIRREIERDEFPIAHVVSEAIKRMEDCRTVTVRLHPLDLKQIESLHEKAAEQGIAAPQLRLVADPSLTRGTCVADGGDFGLLTTWEQQLSDVQRLLREGLDDAQVERRGDETANSGMRRFPDRRETA
jgi:hypothetical protein